MNERLTYAQNLILAKRRGRMLSPAEEAAISDAMDYYGPEMVTMDGELYYSDI